MTAGGLNVTAGATSLGGNTTVSGTLSSTGGIVNTAIGAGGTASTGQFTTLGATSLSTTNAATIGNGLTVSNGGLTVTAGGLTVTAGGLNVTAGAISLGGNTTVSGTLSSTGGIVNTAIGAGSTASTGQFTTLGAASLSTTGNGLIGGALTVNGTLTVNEAVSFEKPFESKQGISTTTLTANTLNLSGNATVGGTLSATGGIINTAIGATGASTGQFTTLGATSLSTTGDGSVGGNLAVTGTSTLTGLLTASNGLTVTAGGLNVTAGGITTDSISVTGNATISGGTLDDVAITDSSFTGGTINNAVIGGAYPVAGTFTELGGTTGTFGSAAITTSLSTPLVRAANALQLVAQSSSVTISTGGFERLLVDGAGNVGIGTTGIVGTPDARLDVNGKVLARSDLTVGDELEVGGVTTLTGLLTANGGITTGAVTASSVSTGTLSASTSLTAPLVNAAAMTSTGALALTATGAGNAIAFSTNGAPRLTIGADGLVDIVGAATFGGAVTLSDGTANGIVFLNGSKALTSSGALTFDGSALAATGTASAAGFIPTGSSVVANGLYLPAANTLAFSTVGAERLRIGADGLVTVAGSMDVVGSLDIADGATVGQQLKINGAVNKVGLVVRAANNQAVNLFEIQDHGQNPLVQVTKDGRMGIGRAPEEGFKLDVDGNVRVTGDVTANTINGSSDRRFKTNIQAITDALSIVRKLQGVSYDWNRAAFPDRGFSARPQIGVIAQEVETVLPELVSTDAQGYKSVNYMGFIPVLIEGMKQQADRIDAQDARLVTAEQTLAMVEERLFKTEEQVIKIDERMGQAEAFVARFSLTREPETMVVLTPTFKVQNLTADRAYIAELRAQRIEAERARFNELDADGATIDSVDAARLRGRVVNTGGKELFVSFGTVAPLFEAAQDGHYIVSVSSEDGSYATAQVINAGGVLRVVPTASQGIDVVANGTSVGLLAPSKKVKASWTRTG